MNYRNYTSGMLTNDMPQPEWDAAQKFDANGMPIPIGPHPFAGTDAVPKMMTPPMTDEQVHEASIVGQELKAALIEGAKKFLGGDGMLNSKKEPKKRHFSGHPTASMEKPKSEKPGWTMAEGTNFWVVNETDPYWQTSEGYKEAVELYGFKPGWVKEPVKKTNVVNYQPTRRISL